jgi:polar amino acid transport system substrate-binding protein
MRQSRLAGSLPLSLLAAALAAAGCDLPADPGGTLERVRGGVLRAGVGEAPPWTSTADPGPPSGIEPALVRGFAEGLGARVEWTRGTEAELLGALEERRLDVVVAGLLDDTLWASRVGLTRPYASVSWLVVPAAGNALPGRPRVEVPEGRPRLAAMVEDAGGIPVRAGSEPTDAVLAPAAAVPAARPAGAAELARERHVMAVPPGENGFLMALERHLSARRGEVTAAQAEAAR